MAVVDQDEAIRRAIRSFYEKSGFEEYEKTSGKKSKYSKDFFDGYEKELRKSVSKKPKGKNKDEEMEEASEGEE